MDPRPDTITRLAPDLVRIIAPNPSAFTYWGTNSYLYGARDALALIDPGPDDADHMSAILSALGPSQRISHILVTHSHLDHSPLAARIGAAVGAPVLAFGSSADGQSAVMQQLAASGLAGGGEGYDPDFHPDRRLADGEVITGDGWALRALWTPGHFGNHLCFVNDRIGFCGDLVMGWATSIVSPPDGDLTDFMASCERLLRHCPPVLHAGHGAPIDAPRARLEWLIAHRRSREAAILAQLDATPITIPALTARIYTDVPASLLPAAERNVFAHLIDLTQKNRATAHPSLGLNATFTRI